MSKIGFIGLGTMGRPMAGHLQKAGHDLYVLKHRSPLPTEIMQAGAACTNPKAVASEAEVIMTMLPDTAQVEQVLFGANGVLHGLSNGKLVIDMSSISPARSKEFAEGIRKLGCDYLDAPVSGGEAGAKAATLTVMVGGDEAAFTRARPLLQLMAQKVSHLGASGAGQTAKVANQIMVALNIEAVAEALLFCSKAGVDPSKVREALLGGFAGSKVLEVHGARMINRIFEPGFRIELHQKDLKLALESARELGLCLPNTAATQELLNVSDKSLDHSALVLALEKLAGHSLNPPQG